MINLLSDSFCLGSITLRPRREQRTLASMVLAVKTNTESDG